MLCTLKGLKLWVFCNRENVHSIQYFVFSKKNEDLRVLSDDHLISGKLLIRKTIEGVNEWRKYGLNWYKHTQELTILGTQLKHYLWYEVNELSNLEQPAFLINRIKDNNMICNITPVCKK